MTSPPLPGRALLGFEELFDGAFGDPETRRPYLTVSPSSVGGVLLPFPCPHCGEAPLEAVDPSKRDGYHDASRGHSWCPACRGRYVLDVVGVPLAGALVPGAASAPARVSNWRSPPRCGLDFFGADAPLVVTCDE